MFDFSKDYILEDAIVRLQPLKLEHVDALLDIANEPHIWDYSFVKGDGLENLCAYIKSAMEARNAKHEYPFLVLDKRTNAVAGCTRFCKMSLALRQTRLGYTWYGKKFQGTGLNKHCKFLMFDFAFNTMDMYYIGLGAYEENLRSIAAMKSVGCTVEGRFRKALPGPNGTGRSDAVLLSMLRDEWESSKRDMLKEKLIN